LAALALSLPSALHAQTDFFNTDGGRPLRIQDAQSVEWRALELQFAPLGVERHRAGEWRTSLEPELAFGLLPRTHLSVGFPMLSVRDAHLDAHLNSGDNGPSPTASGDVFGLAGLHLSVFHSLNVETRIPAFAVRGELLVPGGPFGPDRVYPTLTGIVTRTLPRFGPLRVHGNASVTFGRALSTVDASGPGDTPQRAAESFAPFADDLPRWMAGISVDRAFPLQFTLLATELVASRSLLADDDVALSARVGARHQLSPRIVVDLGVGRQFTGREQHWSVTIGSAVALNLGRRIF
jgi:hypothetical protein